MQKRILLNITGIAALSLLCACGPLAEKKDEAKSEETKKEALADIPAPAQEAAAAVAQTDQTATQAATDQVAAPAATTVAMGDEDPSEKPASNGDETEEKA